MATKSRRYIVTINVLSRTGAKPLVRTLGGDTVFCSLVDGMTATWTLKRQKPKAGKEKPPA